MLDAAVADFNGDGRPDVLAALKNANRIAWFENQPPAPLARKNFTQAWALYE